LPLIAAIAAKRRSLTLVILVGFSQAPTVGHDFRKSPSNYNFAGRHLLLIP